MKRRRKGWEGASDRCGEKRCLDVFCGHLVCVTSVGEDLLFVGDWRRLWAAVYLFTGRLRRRSCFVAAARRLLDFPLWLELKEKNRDENEWVELTDKPRGTGARQSVGRTDGGAGVCTPAGHATSRASCHVRRNLCLLDVETVQQQRYGGDAAPTDRWHYTDTDDLRPVLTSWFPAYDPVQTGVSRS